MTVRNQIPNRKIICDVLREQAKEDASITVLCSDSRGSASMAPFFEEFPDQSVEIGIAEQNLVSAAAGMAHCGHRAFAFSPACFISTRSYEQCKVDVAYSNTNVKVIGISGGISYGALGMSHHSAQDIAAMSGIPNMRIYLPSDRFLTRKLMEHLVRDDKPAYVRVGRNPVEDIYEEKTIAFEMDRAIVLRQGEDVALIACGEMVQYAKAAAELLLEKGIHASVTDMYCVKPLDTETLGKVTRNADLVVTIEEHSYYGGLGAMVSQFVSAECPKRVLNIALPDASVITGTSHEVFSYYGMDGEGIVAAVERML